MHKSYIFHQDKKIKTCTFFVQIEMVTSCILVRPYKNYRHRTYAHINLRVCIIICICIFFSLYQWDGYKGKTEQNLRERESGRVYKFHPSQTNNLRGSIMPGGILELSKYLGQHMTLLTVGEAGQLSAPLGLGGNWASGHLGMFFLMQGMKIKISLLGQLLLWTEMRFT